MNVAEIQKKLSPVFRTYHLKRAALFGSVARGDAGKQSDVDLLISPGVPMGLISYNRFINDVEKILGVPVDVVTEGGLNKFIRPFATKDLKIIYEG